MFTSQMPIERLPLRLLRKIEVSTKLFLRLFFRLFELFVGSVRLPAFLFGLAIAWAFRDLPQVMTLKLQRATLSTDAHDLVDSGGKQMFEELI
jgi:hypothetical protein